MRMEENTTVISNNKEVKTEIEENKSQDVVSPPDDTPRPSSNGPSIKTEQQHTETKESQGHKRKKPPEGLSSKKPREIKVNNSGEDSDDDSDAGDYCMILTDVSKLMVVDKVLRECRIILASKEKLGKHQIKLTFRSSEDVLKLQQKLNEKGLNWKVVAVPPGQDGEPMDNTSDTTEVLESLWKQDEEEDDPLGLYGLRLEFLKSLNITPPLDRWVHVTNFRCDKHELRDVLEMAGRVLSCSVIHITKKYAKVQYSHPLEAVQAISMFNGQLFYGQKLQVYMEKNPNNDMILPKGLANIGLGLGLQGRPIRDVERQYEKYTDREKSSLNPALFRRSSIADDGLLDYKEFMASVDKRSFTVKNAFEIDSTGSGQSDNAKMSCSPDSNDVKSDDDKDFNKSREFNKTSVPTNLPQPEVPGSTNPMSQTANDSGLNKIPTLSARFQAVPSAPYRPGPPGPQIQAPSNQYPGAIQPGPSNTHNPISNPSNSNPLAYSQSFKPQMPGVGLGPVSRPEPVRGPGPVYGTGPIQGSGAAHGPGQIHGPGFNHAPGPIFGPGPVQVPGPVQGPGPIHGPGQVQGPGPIHGPGPVQGPGPIHGPGPVQGPRPGQAAGPTFGPGYARGPAPNSMSTPGPMGLQNSRVTMQLSNLPPSTTFPLLCEKLSHCGQVMSLQFTTPGCAIVTFGHLSHAQKCLQTYNGMTVDGYTIVVTFL